MKFIALVAALAAIVPAAFAQMTINSPSSLVECEPTLLSWTGGTAPYYLTILPGGQASGTPLETLPNQNGTSYTWDVNLAANTQITIALKDSTGTTVYTSTLTIQAGSSTSCLSSSAQPASNTGGSGASTAGNSATSAAAAGTTAPSVASATPAGSSGSASAGSASPTASGSTTSPSGTSSSGAGRLGVSTAFGVAGLMGLVGAALF